MDSHIQHLIDELLEIDPTLGQREEFSRMVEMMVRVRPQIKLRENFEHELRREIVRHAELVSASSSRERSWNKFGMTLPTWFSWKNLSFFSTSLAFAAFAIFAYRQVDLFSDYKKEIVPWSTMMETPPLGGVVNRMIPQASLKRATNEQATTDSMAAVKNMSPKLDWTADIIAPIAQKVTTPKSDTQARTLQVPTEVSTKKLPETSANSQPQIPQTTPPQEYSGVNNLSVPAPSADIASPSAMAKVAVTEVRYSYSGDLPAFEPLQSVVIESSGGQNAQDFPAKSIEVIRDELVKGWYYAKDNIFDGVVRDLKNLRMETLTITKDNETYRLGVIIADVINPGKTGPTAVIVVLAEGF